MSHLRLVIAIDGPAGVGKSTTAREIAKHLGYVLVDTGALYRGVALAAKEQGVAWDQGEALGELAARLDLGFRPDSDGSVRLIIDGVDRAQDIRTPEISQGASQVSAHPQVREALLAIQRKLGREGGVVLEGRDIGTVVFPNAELKIFLSASPQERARRRVSDLKGRGIEAEHDEILRQILERDEADSTRAIAPLRPASDAVEIDSTELACDDVVNLVLRLAKERSASDDRSP